LGSFGSAGDVVGAPRGVIIGHQSCHGHLDFLMESWGLPIAAVLEKSFSKLVGLVLAGATRKVFMVMHLSFGYYYHTENIAFNITLFK